VKVKVSEQSIKHLVDNDCVDMVVEYIRKLEAENARLKAEVERLTAVSEAWKKRRLDKVEAECINWAEVEKENARLKAIVESHHIDLNLQNARLKAEVERMTERNDTLSMRYDTAWALINVQTNYIERLTKAGDAMADTLRDGGVIVSGYSLADEWLKAKLYAAKGVQS
jgi:hypothetical protein